MFDLRVWPADLTPRAGAVGSAGGADVLARARLETGGLDRLDIEQLADEGGDAVLHQASEDAPRPGLSAGGVQGVVFAREPSGRQGTTVGPADAEGDGHHATEAFPRLGAQAPRPGDGPTGFADRLYHGVADGIGTVGGGDHLEAPAALGAIGESAAQGFLGGLGPLRQVLRARLDVADGEAKTDAEGGANKLIGKCVRAAADADATVRIRMSQ